MVVLDQNGAEINPHWPFGFLGESNPLSGQTVFLTAVVTSRCAKNCTVNDAVRELR